MTGGRTTLNLGNSSPRRISSQDCRWALFISAQKFEVQQSGCGHLRVLPILGLSRRRTARPRSQAWTTRGSGSRACRLRCTPDHVAGRHDLECLAARAADHELPLRPHAKWSTCGPAHGWVPWGGMEGMAPGTHREEKEGVVRELGEQQLRVVVLLFLLVVFLVRA